MSDPGSPTVIEMKPDFDLALRELGDFADRFESLRATPTALLNELRDERDFAISVVRADTRPWLQQWFDEDADNVWAADDEGFGLLGEGSVGVEWVFHGTHSRDGDFHGLPHTGRAVIVEGFSVLRAGETGLRVRRYVNWVAVFQQLGLSMNWRVPLTNPPEPDALPPPHSLLGPRAWRGGS